MVLSSETVEKYPFLGEVNTDDLNLRAGPNINYRSFFQLSSGAMLVVYGKEYSWYKVRLPHHTDCYVKTEYIQFSQGKSTSKVNNLRVRSGPGFNYSVIGKLDKGETIYIKSEGKDWTKVYPTKNSYGWVHSKHVNRVKDKEVLSVDKEIVDREYSLRPSKVPVNTLGVKD